MKKQAIWLLSLSIGVAVVAGCASERPAQPPAPAFRQDVTVSHAPEAPPPPRPATNTVAAPVPPPPATLPPAPEPPAPPARVETGTSVRFDEVMAAVPVEGAHQVYQNLHVGVAATVCPRTNATYNAGHVGLILHKLEPRVSAATLQVVTDSGTISPRRIGALREAVAARIQEVVTQTLSTWEHAADYEVEVTVVSMYFTDSTVGRSDHGRRGL